MTEIMDSPLTPQQFGEALTRAVSAGINPFTPGALPSAWVDILGPMVDETGLRGVGSEYRPYFDGFLSLCDVEPQVVDAAWALYLSIDPQAPETEQSAPADPLIEQYRNLVGALLEHSQIDHEGTEVATNDFLSSDDRAANLLAHLIRAQGEASDADR